MNIPAKMTIGQVQAAKNVPNMLVPKIEPSADKGGLAEVGWAESNSTAKPSIKWLPKPPTPEEQEAILK